MGAIRRFEDLKVWQEARILCQKINNEILCKDNIPFSFKNQIDKSSGFVMDNISEGFERGGNKEFRQFLTISKGSCGEVRSQLYRAKDRNYITLEKYTEMSKDSAVISKMIAGLIKYLNNSKFKGSKFNVEEEDLEYIIKTNTNFEL